VWRWRCELRVRVQVLSSVQAVLSALQLQALGMAMDAAALALVNRAMFVLSAWLRCGGLELETMRSHGAHAQRRVSMARRARHLPAPVSGGFGPRRIIDLT
jgi:hypothetical protein